MSITTRLTWRDLVSNKGRLLLTSIAVILGVSFVSGSFVLRDSLRGVFSNLFEEINKGVDIQVRTKVAFGSQDAANPVPASLVDTVAAVPGVGAASGSVGQATVTVIGKNGKVVEPKGGAPTLGVSWSEDEQLTPVRVLQGERPSGTEQVALDADTAKRAKYAVGDTVTLSLPQGKQQFTLAGIFRFGKTNSLAGAQLVAFEPSAAAELLGTNGGYSTIDVRVADGQDPATVLAAVRAALPSGYEAIDNEQINKESNDTVSGFTDGFAMALLVFAFIALFVSAFIINNTFAILANQKVRELAMLRAIGASAKQVRHIVVLQALVIGLIASVVGILGGLGVALAIKGLISLLGGDLPGGLVLGITPIVAGLAVGMLVTMVSALAPAFRAAKVPPIVAISGNHNFQVGNAARRLVLSAASAVIGLALLVWGLFGKPGGTSGILYLSGGGALLLMLGVAGLSRLIARPLTNAIGLVLARITKLLGRLRRGNKSDLSAMLGRENVGRMPRRTAATASALMIGLALVSAVAVLGASVKQTLRDQLSSSVKADLFLRSANFTGFTPVIAQQMAEVPGIEAVSGFRQGMVKIEGDEKPLGAVDPVPFGKLIDLDVREGSLANLTKDTIFIGKDPAKDYGLKLGDTIEATFPSTGVKSLKVVGIFHDSNVIGSNWLVDTATYEENFTNSPNDFLVAAKVAPGADAVAVRSAVEKIVDDQDPGVKVQDQTQFRKSQEAQVDIAMAMISAFLSLAVIVAVIGIANTLALSVFERTRELGLLRAVGMSRVQLKRTVRWESVLVALFGAVLGIAVGILLGVLVTTALPSAVASTVAIPSVQLLQYVGTAVLAGVWAARKPAKRAAKMNVLQAIAFE